MILVAAPPACGKNYVSDLIGKAMGQISYFDKDDLSVLLRRSFELCGEDLNMDGDFYLQNLRSAEYETLFSLAFSALRFSDVVLVNAPFLKEIRDAEYMRGLREMAGQLGAELILVWVIASSGVCYERMKARSSDRDAIKLAQWEKYVQQVDYSAPQSLVESSAVDKLFVFDNENDEIATGSLRKLLEILGG
jgi:hypothetical protein